MKRFATHQFSRTGKSSCANPTSASFMLRRGTASLKEYSAYCSPIVFSNKTQQKMFSQITGSAAAFTSTSCMMKRLSAVSTSNINSNSVLGTKRSFFSRTYARLGGGSESASESAAATAAETVYIPSATNKAVARWLYLCATLVGTIIVVGGITRLTESGLSIVDWRPVTGVVPPLTLEDWEKEFAKYKNFPEYKQKPNMTLDEFKSIFFWEWFHRFLARSVGMVYVLPFAYFVARGRFANSPKTRTYLASLCLLFAAQGGMGWYMVKSGLKKELLDERRKAAVSAYRLAAHLTLALILFTGFIRIGCGLKHPALSAASASAKKAFAGHFELQTVARLMFGLTFCTAFSGAFVAGLRGGYLYNEGFPLMGGRVFPPYEELFLSDLPLYKNFLENPVMAQTWHRVMAGITTATTIGLNLTARRVAARNGGVLPPQVRRALMMVYGAVALQVTLGMLTIITRMHMHMAATHQSGAVFLLAMVCRLCAILGSRGIIL